MDGIRKASIQYSHSIAQRQVGLDQSTTAGLLSTHHFAHTTTAHSSIHSRGSQLKKNWMRCKRKRFHEILIYHSFID